MGYLSIGASMRFPFKGVVVTALHWAIIAPAFGQAPLERPNALVLSEARAIVQRMIDNARGPYSRIRWYCNDGTVQPPAASACAEHGGGRQHAEYAAERSRLAELGWSVGTIFAALDYAELANDRARRQRLRELPLERYLIDIDDGWVLRRARNYRGRTQIEDEEALGRELLVRLLGDRDWVAGNFLLARESVRTIPHTGDSDDIARLVRRSAIEIVARDASFEPLRAEIHGAPSSATAARVRTWAANKPAELVAAAGELATQLELLYSAEGRRSRMLRHRDGMAREPVLRELAAYLDAEAAQPTVQRVRSLAELARAARRIIERDTTSPRVRLRLFDMLIDLEGELAVTISESLSASMLTRAELFELAARAANAAYGTGVLTREEHDVLQAVLDIDSENSLAVAMQDYLAAVESLKRVPHWAAGSVRHAFAEPLVKYAALDTRAAGFVDDLMRSSVLVGLGEITRRLAIDVASLTGVAQLINGREGLPAFGLNAGIARGRLKVFSTDHALRAGSYTAADVVLLPETTPELEPIAGIVTLGEGNPLSHVQLLARNFGIPNIAIAPSVLPVLEEMRDVEVITAVATDGSLVLMPFGDLTAELKATVRPAAERRASLRVPPVDLTVRNPIRLADLDRSLSGRVVGPKAANLGELARLFPGRVAPALAIPFGLYAAHVGRSGDSPRDRLVTAYAEHDAGLIDDPELNLMLAAIRAEIASLTIDEPTRAVLLEQMRWEFGEPESYGLFVRSDTNVEDLPEFTGAGLSETVPNVTDLEALFATIPRVWSSVLSPRAIAWRSNLLENPEAVFASVLLMQSVPSTKSGVLVTTNLIGVKPGLTVSAAWGVGGGVGGEATESLVLHTDGSETLVSGAKSAYQRRLDAAGGLAWAPAPEGAVLSAQEKTALRELAAEVLARYQPVYDDEGAQRPWDIEYGFVRGELTLFQIRPLVERGQRVADRVVRALTQPAPDVREEDIVLDEFPIVRGAL